MFNLLILKHCSLEYGFRHLTWDSEGLQVNGERVYLRGVARHEDSAVRGKGLDLVRWCALYSILSITVNYTANTVARPRPAGVARSEQLPYLPLPLQVQTVR